MNPPKIEPVTNITNIAILLWPSNNNPDVINSVGIGITEDSKLFMNRPINPSFTRYGLFRNVILPIFITSGFKNESSDTLQAPIQNSILKLRVNHKNDGEDYTF